MTARIVTIGGVTYGYVSHPPAPWETAFRLEHSRWRPSHLLSTQCGKVRAWTSTGWTPSAETTAVLDRAYIEAMS